MKPKTLNVMLLMLFLCFSANAFSLNLVDVKEYPETDNDSLKFLPVRIPELKGSFKFDGIVDDPCWDSLPRIPLVMHIPTFGLESTENSDVFFCHDNAYLYIGGRFFDKEADKIGISSRMRDLIGPQDDAFMVIFDTFNDHENGVGFQTNAAGVRYDLTIAHDGTEAFPWNDTWNTFWDAKSSRNAEGWYTEMRIPLSSLRFEEKDGKVTMGFICWRFIPRKFEVDIFPAIDRKWGFWSFVKISQSHLIELNGVHSKKPFYIGPYITSGLNQESLLNDAGTGYRYHNYSKVSAGLDLKYGITSNLTADITIRTDFAQVESDNAQINLTRFSLFMPEKRMFFQERASNFAFSFDDMNTLFYSRQIGLHEGRPVPIIGGVRLVGRAGPWDLGFLNMQTGLFNKKDTSEVDLPAENFSVLRLRRQVINANSYVGGILTSRLGMNGSYNEVIGLDGIIRIFGDDYIDVKYARSFDDKYINKILSLDASRIWFDWQRRNEKGLGYDFFISRAGETFEPDMGFEFRKDYYMIGTKLKYGWLPGESSAVASHIVYLNGQIWRYNKSNITQSAFADIGYSLELKSSTGFQVNFRHAYENLADTFYLSNDANITYIKPTGYKYNYAYCLIHSPYTKSLTFEIRSNLGQYYDGTEFSVNLKTGLKVGAVLNLEPIFETYRIRFNNRKQAFSGHIVSLKSLLMLSNKLSVSSLIQYSNIEHGIGTNVRLRFNAKEGNDFYIVYNEGRNIELTRETPVLSRIASRSLLLKYTYTFIL